MKQKTHSTTRDTAGAQIVVLPLDSSSSSGSNEREDYRDHAEERWMKRCSKEKRTGSRSSPFRWLQALSSSRLLFACSPSLATEVEVDAVLAMQLRRTLKRTTRQSHQGLPGTRATTACAPYASNSAGLVRRPCAATDSARPASSRRGSVGTAQGRSHSPAPAAARP